MPTLLAICTALMLSSPLVGANSLTHDELGFRFAPPPFPAEATGQVFMVFMPAADGFAANINLLVQPFTGTLAEYHQVTQKEFAHGVLDVVSSDLGSDEIRYEYTGTMNKLDLHWLARARKSGDRIHLLTATGLAARWNEEGPHLTAALNSYTLAGDGIKDVIAPPLPPTGQ